MQLSMNIGRCLTYVAASIVQETTALGCNLKTYSNSAGRRFLPQAVNVKKESIETLSGKNRWRHDEGIQTADRFGVQRGLRSHRKSSTI
jgi:hypothetical protein